MSGDNSVRVDPGLRCRTLRPALLSAALLMSVPACATAPVQTSSETPPASPTVEGATKSPSPPPVVSSIVTRVPPLDATYPGTALSLEKVESIGVEYIRWASAGDYLMYAIFEDEGPLEWMGYDPKANMASPIDPPISYDRTRWDST